jgi:TDG/mug DNA glycosylase family protein
LSAADSPPGGFERDDGYVLPDLLRPGLRLVFCGTAPSAASMARLAYYAGPGNRFWPILAETGLTPRRLAPEEYGLLPQFGIGLTDIAKTAAGNDSAIPASAYDAIDLARRIRAVRPALLAFTGKNAAARFLGRPTGQIGYGPGPAVEDFPPLFVLPSTSGAARGSWDARWWHALASQLKESSQRLSPSSG